MIELTQSVSAPADRVFAVLADGWSFAAWVIGASHIRAVDPHWPLPGSRILHSVGVWPFVVQDQTVVRAHEPGSLLELEARVWPVGKAKVRLTVTALGPARTEVRMAEEVVAGPFLILPDIAQAPYLVPRNRESLRRLADIAQGRPASERETHP